jgi:hypothetical protein
MPKTRPRRPSNCDPHQAHASLVDDNSTRAQVGRDIESKAVRLAPSGLGTVDLAGNGNAIIATLTDTALRSEEHNFGILILDTETGVPVGLNYTERTEHAPASGPVQTVTRDLTEIESVPSSLRAYLMVDAYPAAVATVE